MKRRWIVFLLTAALALTAATGCGKQTAKSGTSGKGTAAETLSDETGTSGEDSDEKALVPIRWVNGDTDYETSPSATYLELKEALAEYAGVDITFEYASAQDLDLMFASGDLPDIFTVKSERITPLLTGKRLVNLDDYIELAPNLEKLSPIRTAALRKYFSNGDGGLYFWTPYVGNESAGASMWNGLTIRWDWYKELGYPEVKNEDDFLDVVKQIVEKHPTTENGDQVYGVATYSDLWGWWVLGDYWGYHTVTDGLSVKLVDDSNEMISNYGDVDGPLWRAIEYYFKANQLGIFDPDSLTMKGDDLNAKCTNGQVVSTVCTRYAGSLYNKAKEEDPDTLKGYMVLPMEGQYNWDNATSNVGWAFYTAASADSPYIEQIMKVFDYMNSEECSRLMSMGKEGRVWEYVDGVPTIKQEYIELRSSGDQEKINYELGTINRGRGGLSENTILSDGAPGNLWNTPDIWKIGLSPIAKDFCEHYGVEYPAEAARNLVREGKAYDKAAGSLALDVIAVFPPMPDDLNRIDNRCRDIMIKAIPNLVLADNRDTFEQIKQETLDELDAAGIQKTMSWCKENSEDVLDFLRSVQNN